VGTVGVGAGGEEEKAKVSLPGEGNEGRGANKSVAEFDEDSR